jgi:hypothetical protein
VTMNGLLKLRYGVAERVMIISYVGMKILVFLQGVERCGYGCSDFFYSCC